MSFSSSVGTFGGGVRRRHALNVLEDEGPPQHRRRAVRVGGRHQHGAFAEQPPARRLLELDPPEAIAFHVGDPVMERDALVEIRVLRSQQIDHAAVFPEDAVGEERQLGAEILARIRSAGGIREHRRVRHDLVEALHVEPLMDEIARQRHGTRIGQHAPDLPVEHGGLAQLAVDAELQQLLIGNRVPEEERQLRRELEIADSVGVAGTQTRRDVFATVQKERARQKTGDGAADASLEAAVLHAVLVILEQLVHVLGGNRPPVCAPGQRRDDLFGARRLCLRIRVIRSGWQLKIRSRLGVGPSPFASNGP